MAEIKQEKWQQYYQLTVDEAMNLISGFEPETYRFCYANEEDMPPDSVPIYRALIHDLNASVIAPSHTPLLVMYFSGEKADFPNICKFVHGDEFDNSCWWSGGKLQVADLKKWLRQRGFSSTFFEVGNANRANIPDYLNDECDEYSPKLAAAVRVWEHFHDPKNILPGKSLKDQMMKWLEDNAHNFKGKLSAEAIKEISKVANWNTKGGAPRQSS